MLHVKINMLYVISNTEYNRSFLNNKLLFNNDFNDNFNDKFFPYLIIDLDKKTCIRSATYHLLYRNDIIYKESVYDILKLIRKKKLDVLFT